MSASGGREQYVSGCLDGLFLQWFVRAGAWGALLFLMLSALDYISAPQYFSLFLKYRLISSSLLLLSAFVAARTSNRYVHYLLAYAAIAASAVTIELMILKFGGHASSYYTGMILLGISVLGFIPARFHFHVISALLIYLIYLVPIVALERITNVQAFFTSNAFMSLIFITALLMRYMSDLGLVKGLEMRYDLEQSKEHLEDAVRDRTNELSQTVVRLQQEIDERVRTEERLQHYVEELKYSNDELKSFVYSASHDLRTPLVNITGFAAELTSALEEDLGLINACIGQLPARDRDRLAKSLQEDVPAALKYIGASVSRMDVLIAAMLKLAHLGRRRLKPVLVPLEVHVRSAASRVALEADRGSPLAIVGELPYAVADGAALEEILVQLLDNALKYASPGRPAAMTVSAERHENGTVVRVSDNGRGIAPEDRHKVFEIFRRVGPQDQPGEGMGLAYAKALVRRHGGRIWCESEPGEGSTFGFTLPDTAGLPSGPAS